VHTVNATALAAPRIILSILENYWNEDKQVVEMPEVLKPYLPFEKISKKRQGVLINSDN
jgi:seryl-tRNA synthetase